MSTSLFRPGFVPDGPFPDDTDFHFGATAVPDAPPGVTGAALDFAAAAPSATGAAGDGLPLKDENGSGTGTATVAASGDQRIDGILAGVKWSSTSITYSDPTSASQYQSGHPEAFTNFQHISTAQLNTAHAALNQSIYGQPLGAGGYSVEGFTNLSLTYAGANGNGTIRMANTSDPATAYAYYPSTGVWGGDAFYGGSGRNPVAGNYDYHTMIHELGHALGLKHGQDTSVYGALPSDTDSMEFSVMTYRSYVGGPLTGYSNEQYGYAQTFMMYDIAALQYMYGADFTDNAGNTTYSWDPSTGASYVDGVLSIAPGGNRIFQTIWDGNGTDTYDLSNYATNLNVDLTPGGYSTFSSTQLAYLGAGHYARGNVFNALQYQSDARSLIENAIGGSGSDSLNGNDAANTLTGNAGNDTLLGNSGVDTLYGGDGNDRLDGGLYADFSYGGAGNDTFVIKGADIADNVDGGSGIDTLDLTGYTNTSLGFSVNLAAHTYDFIPTAFGPFSITNVENVNGSERADTLVGDALANLLSAKGGNDMVNGGDGNDSLEGAAGNDTVQGGNGNDTVKGGGGDDSVQGGNNNDDVHGNDGNDRLFGGVGADTLNGDAGNDVLQGNDNRDVLVGGLGNDTFDFDFLSDSPVGNAVCDVIQAGGGAAAFEGAGAAAGDRIDLSTIDANTTLGGNQAFVFGGTGKGHVWCVNAGTTTEVFLNVDNDAAAEFQLNILDGGVLASAYKAADFIL